MKWTKKQEQKLIAKLYADGYSMSQIATKLLIGMSTVRRRLIAEKVVIRSKSEGVKLASRQGRLNKKRPRS